ncbi:uncharacterized protein LOC6562299 [Drosophila grimshawi]|uniref:GH10735 n=1 Tax=Drosophila grimshawi TaxID=7222 RepID=B4JBR0_DROGR|nr:uncharacterized protein LOC6562299 [Drosophila grimshawi]EDW02995.1 GH10735 [Drosophila grimshawi]
MEFQEYLQKQLNIFNYHLHSDYGLLIKTATCIAFGALCGWLMGIVTWMLYKIAKWLEVLPVTEYNYQDDDLDLDSQTDIGYNIQPESSIATLIARQQQGQH